MLSVVTDYIIHSPGLLERAVTKPGTNPSDIIRVLAQCWQNTLPSGKRGLDVQSFHNLTATLARCASQLRTYHLHDPFKVVLKQAMRLKEQACADLGTMCFPTIEPNFPRIAEMSYNKMRRFRSQANLVPVAATLPAYPSPAHQKLLPRQVRPVYQPLTIRQKVSTPVRLLHSVRPQPPRSTASSAIRTTHILARKVLHASAQRNIDTSVPKLLPAPHNLPASTSKNPSTLAQQNQPTQVRKVSPQNPCVQAREIPSSPFPAYTSTLAAQSPSVTVPMSPPPARQIPSTHTQQMPSTPFPVYSSTLSRQNPAATVTKQPSSPSTTSKGFPSSRHSTSSPVRQTPSLAPATAGYTLQRRRPYTPTRHQPTTSIKTRPAPHAPQPIPSACVGSSATQTRNLATSPQSANRLTSNQRLLIHAELRRLHLVSSSPAMPRHTPRMSLTPNKQPNTSAAASGAPVLHHAQKRFAEARQSVYRQTQVSTLHPADRTVTKELFFN
ncbi:proteoglycan 4-like [Haliotis rubra]|uniref:proteoglycan 4-like n=1 Tax=Haliotis rubra TaxID=36100 RepID=UPI001EE5CAD5|nr:proteoglycan 4-like [Haliotis rubra]